MSSDSPYYMPPSSYRRDSTADDKDRTTGSAAPTPAVKRESTWRPGASSSSLGASKTSAPTTSRSANAWASRDSPRDPSPGPSQGGGGVSRSRNDSYYEPPDAASSQRSVDDRRSDRGADSRDRDRDRDRGRDRDRDGDRGGDSGWRRGRRADRDDDRGTWDDYRRRMDSKRRDSPDRDRGGWGRRRKDDDDNRRTWGRADDRSSRNGDRDRGWGDRWRKSDTRDKSPEDSRDRRRSLSRSRSRSRDRSPPSKRRARRSSFTDSDSDSDRDIRRRSPRDRSITPEGKRRAPPSPRLPSAKRLRDKSPPRRRRSPSRGRSSSRSVTPPPHRKSTSPRSTNGRGDRARSPESPLPAYGPRSSGRYQDRDAPTDRSQPAQRDRAPERDRLPDRDRADKDRWQPTPPRGPREFEQRFGRQAFNQPSNGPVKMRQWGAAAKSRTPSPAPQPRRSSPHPPRSPATVPAGPPPATVPVGPPGPSVVPTQPAAQAAAPVIPPGFRRAPPTGPRQRAPPTGPANPGPAKVEPAEAAPANGNGAIANPAASPRKPTGGWRPIQQPIPVTPESFKRALAGEAEAPEASEAKKDAKDDAVPSPRVPSPKRSDQWSPNKWSPNKWSPAKSSSALLGPETYLDRLADKERQYDQHLSSVAPYVSAAFSQWYAQNTTPHLPEFLVHYFGRRPSKFELDQIQALLARRTQLARDEVELRNLHEQALKLENKDSGAEQARADPASSLVPTGFAEAPARSTQPMRAGPGESYERISQVGEGTYGKVYKARSVNSGVLVALKRIRMEQEKDGFPVTSMREIKLLQALHHPNVVLLQEMMVSKGSVYMVLEYMNHDLTGILSHPEVVLSAANIKSLNYQMLSGLGYLHRRGILHRDMKGSNILLNGDGELKLADFGLARFYHKHKRGDYTNRVITLWYRSPELLMGETCYGPEVDTWSAGCIALEIFTTKPVFQGSDEINQLEVIYQVMGTPDESTWPGITELPWYELVRPRDVVSPRFRASFAKWLSPAALDLVEGLLTFNPSKRLLADEALELPYFTSEQPKMERPTQLAACGEHHEMSVKLERHRRREGK